jgi:phage replication-related protein YjqB (UPF0714/DUF867 family)
MADTFQNFAELSAAYTEGTDFTVKYEKKGTDVAVIAIHGGGIEVGSSELMYAIQAQRPTWSWYEFNARLSSGNSVLHLTSTHFDDQRAIDVVSSVDRVVSVHGAAGTEAKTLIGGLDVLTKDFIERELVKRGFVVEKATTESGIAGQEPLNIANRSKLGGVQLELTTKQRAVLFKNEDTSRTWRENPANWSQAMYDYRDAVLEGVALAQRLKQVARDRLSIIDLNDVVASVKPVNPSEGQIYLDQTRTPNMLQIWDGDSWNDLGEVDTETSKNITAINQKLSDMANDSLISIQERQMVKNDLTKMLGFVIDDTTATLPTASTLDASFKGDFYTLRKSAQLAGISTSNATYVATATAYTNLKAYLDGRFPYPWDTSAANADKNITVVAATWRDKWLQYELAMQALQSLITFNIKDTIDKIEVGGANLLDATSFAVRPLMWNGATGEVVPSGVVGVPNSLKVMKDPANNSYGFTVYGKHTLKSGQTYTVSFELKLDATQSTINYLYLRGDNITNTRLSDLTADTTKAGTFVRYTLTFVAPSDVVNAGIMIGLASPNTSSFEARKVQLEKGNRASDWSLSNSDVTNGINDVNGKVDGLQIGTRNLVRNSTFLITNDTGSLTGWTYVEASYIIEPPETDKPTSNILHIIQSGNASEVWKSAYSNKFQAKKGDVFTVSMDIKVKDLAAYDSQYPWLFEFYDATGTRIQYVPETLSTMGITLVNDTWARIKRTYTATTSGIATAAVRLIMYKNGEVFYREVQVERGNVATDYKYAPEDSIDQITVLEQTVSDIKQSTSDEAIVNAVTNSTAYQFDLNSKADADSLSNYATTGQLDEAIQGASDDVDKKIAGIDFSPYVKTSALEQTVDAITAKFSKAGGINQIKNSVGYSGFDFWTPSGYEETIQTDELAQLGFGSAFYCPITHSMTMTQDVYTIVGQVYSFSYYLKKLIDSGTNSYARVDILDQLGNVVATLGYASGTGITNGFEKLTATFTATTSLHTIKYTTGSGSESIATGFMFNIGEIPLNWSLSVGEMYNANVKTNENGIKVNNVVNGEERGFTVMTPSKFAGYFDVDNNGVIDETPNSVDEVFRIDGDEFVQKKAVIKEELTMGLIKVVRIESSTSNGWAFVGNEDD